MVNSEWEELLWFAHLVVGVESAQRKSNINSETIDDFARANCAFYFHALRFSKLLPTSDLALFKLEQASD